MQIINWSKYAVITVYELFISFDLFSECLATGV